MRLLSDVCLSLQYKQWWIFRTKNTLWGHFLKAKYCQRANPVIKKRDTGQSLVWKHMMTNKVEAETHIKWIIRSGTCSFWWDDWLGVGPLANHRITDTRPNNIRISEFLIDGNWNKDMVRQTAPPPLLISKILNTNFQFQQGIPDRPVWKPNASGHFTCSSAWDVVRQKKNKAMSDSFTWHKHIPFKISFLLWRALRGKLPTNERITTFGSEPVDYSRCYRPGPDTIDHIFMSGNFAKHIWKIFSDSVTFSIAPFP